MPIEFAPPPPATQGYQITPPQSTDPLQTLAQMGQLRTQGLQQQSAQLGLQQQQLKMQSQKAMVNAFAQGGTPDQIYQRAIASGQVLPEDAIAFQQHQMKYQTDAQALDEKKRQALSEDIGNYVGAASQATDQASLDAANAAAAKRGLFDSKKFDPIAQYPGDDTHFQAQLNGLLSHKQILDSAKTVAETGEATAKTGEATAAAGKATADTAKTQLESQQLKSQLDFMEGLTPKTLGDLVGASIDKTKYPDLYARAYNDASNARAMRKPELMQAAIDKYATIASEQEKTISTETNPAVRQARTDQAVATARAVAPIKIDVAGQVAAATAGARADAAGLTDDDYSRAGEQYIRTGVMPAVGRDSLTRGRIVKAGNQFARDNGLSPSDVITMQAAYAGDKDSLKKFQAQRDQIVSFEQTAQKNLDLFLGLASKIPDTGVPWLNTPIRKLDSSIVGSENMAAVNAARQIANNEIAKVTSGGGLSGVLSDSARHEVEGYNPQNATFAQTKAVANILKQDMANRHGSMDATLSDIKARIGGGGQEVKAPVQHKVGDLVEYQGKLHKIKSIENGKLRLDPNPVQQ
jgi:hypothetical protein